MDLTIENEARAQQKLQEQIIVETAEAIPDTNEEILASKAFLILFYAAINSRCQ